MGAWMKLIVIALLFVAMLLAAFWQELSETFAESFDGVMNTSVIQPQLPTAQNKMIVGFRLSGTLLNNPRVALTGLRSSKVAERIVRVNFEIANLAIPSSYPSLRVYLMGRDGEALRALTYLPDEYRHGPVFMRETITLDLKLRSGEQSFTVEAF